MIALIIGVALAAVSLGVIAYPLIGRRAQARATNPVLELQERREAIYQQADLLRQDLALENISEADYAREVQHLRHEAAEMLLAQQRLQELAQALEAEILQARSGHEP